MARTPVLKPTPATTGLGEKSAPVDMMGAMKRQRGAEPAKPRTSVDILRDGLMEQIGDPQAVQQLMGQLDQLAQAGLTRLVQIGNTVFLVNQYDSNRQMLPQGTAEVHMFTDEPLEALAQRFAAVANTLKQMGYQRAISYATEPGMTRVLQGAAQQAKVQLQVRQDVQNIGGEMTPVYRIEVTL